MLVQIQGLRPMSRSSLFVKDDYRKQDLVWGRRFTYFHMSSCRPSLGVSGAMSIRAAQGISPGLPPRCTRSLTSSAYRHSLERTDVGCCRMSACARARDCSAWALRRRRQQMLGCVFVPGIVAICVACASARCLSSLVRGPVPRGWAAARVAPLPPDAYRVVCLAMAARQDVLIVSPPLSRSAFHSQPCVARFLWLAPQTLLRVGCLTFCRCDRLGGRQRARRIVVSRRPLAWPAPQSSSSSGARSGGVVA